MKQFCRACLHKLVENNERILKHKIVFMELTSLQIEDDDNLPKAVCDTCISQLLQFKSFKETCIKSDAYLRRPRDDNSEAVFHLENIKVENISASAEYEEIDATKQSIVVDLNDKSVRRRSARTRKRTSTDFPEQTKMNSKRKSVTRSIKIDRIDLKVEVRSEYEDTDTEAFPTESNIESEKADKSNMKPYQCHECKKRYKSLDVLEIHLNLHKTGLKQCNICERSFTTLRDVVRHKLTHKSKDNRNIKCTVCNKVITERSFQHHMQLHEKHKGSIVCDTCGLPFVTMGDFNAHKMKHIVVELPCTICGKIYTNKKALYDHTTAVHERKYSTQEECKICGKKVAYRKLNQHCKLHHTVYTTTENIFACKQCDVKCRTKRNLAKHIQVVHIGERKYACTLCPKTYGHLTLLKRHAYFHSGERPVHCEVCNKGFYIKAALDTHMNIHKRQWIAQGVEGITLHEYPRNKKKTMNEYYSDN